MIGLLMSLIKKKELTGNCPVSSNVVQDMGEEFDFEAKPLSLIHISEPTRPY